jgi:hypothetical protein
VQQLEGGHISTSIASGWNEFPEFSEFLPTGLFAFRLPFRCRFGSIFPRAKGLKKLRKLRKLSRGALEERPILVAAPDKAQAALDPALVLADEPAQAPGIDATLLAIPRVLEGHRRRVSGHRDDRSLLALRGPTNGPL